MKKLIAIFFFILCMATFVSADTLMYDNAEVDPETSGKWDRNIGAVPSGMYINLSTEQAQSGTHSYKVYLPSVPSGQSYDTGAGELHVELLSLTAVSGEAWPHNFTFGTEYWVQASVFIPADIQFPQDAQGAWALLGQFHNSEDACDSVGLPQPIGIYLNSSTGGVTLTVRAKTDACSTSGTYSRSVAYNSAALNKGAFNTFLFNFKFSYTSGGFFKAWLNDTQFANDSGVNCYNDTYGLNLRFGLYGELRNPITVYYDDFYIGTGTPGEIPDPPDPPDPPSGNNLALNKTASASSTEDAYLVAANAVDGVTETRWSSEFTDSQWFKVDLGEAYTIDRVVLTWETAYGDQYLIETSTDNSSWTTAVTENASDGGTDTHQFSAVSARYVRMTGVSRATAWGYSLYEFEVYGETTGTAPTITANCWSDSAGTCLSANQTITQAEKKVYQKITLSEAGYHLNGLSGFYANITASATGSRPLLYGLTDQPAGMGYGTTSFLMVYAATVSDKASGPLQLLSSTLGGQIVDNEGNQFDMTGLNTALTYTPALAVQTAQRQIISITGTNIEMSINGKPVVLGQ